MKKKKAHEPEICNCKFLFDPISTHRKESERKKKKKNVNKINAVRARWHEGTDIFGCHFMIVA